MPKFVLKMRTYHSDMIRILFESLKDILTDVNIVFDSSGMKIVAIDAATRSALVHAKLDAEKIRKDGYYECPRILVVGVNMSNLFRLVKTVTKDDVISFYIEEGNESKLGIQIENSNKNSVTNFKLQLLDIDEAQITIPDIDFSAVITIPSQDFQKYCRDMSNLSDTMEIRSVDNQLILSCEGDFANQEIVIGESEGGKMEFTDSYSPDEVIQGEFSLKFLTLFTKATNLCSSIQMYLKNDSPLLLDYGIANLGNIKFVLAQKITKI